VLVELSVVEQRYHAVMEVAAGVPVAQVAARYGVSRQSVHAWVRKYGQSGLAGLADRSQTVTHTERPFLSVTSGGYGSARSTRPVSVTSTSTISDTPG
jgi:transposase-like protein